MQKLIVFCIIIDKLKILMSQVESQVAFYLNWTKLHIYVMFQHNFAFLQLIGS